VAVDVYVIVKVEDDTGTAAAPLAFDLAVEVR
jgi:hypothetical protein